VESGIWEARLDWPGPVEETGLDVVFAGRHAAQLITIIRARGHIQVSLLTREAPPPADQQLTEILHAAAAADLIPPAPPVAPRCTLASAGVALDLETHVGKRCLLIGEAGGFVSAFSQERLYPAMKSGWLAAETAARALRANLPQDELSSFSAAWRTELADYLRLPNTNLGLLMPLVFDNAQMSERVARAFLLGQSF
jgi:flavin-dependent dehydrogenase